MTEPKMSPAELNAFLKAHFPHSDVECVVDAIENGRLYLRTSTDQRHLRPGGTVSGPTLMAAADTAFYCLLLATIGPVELAVTTHLSIDFLRKPPPSDVFAEAEMLKLGRRLAVGRVILRAKGDEAPVAHATVTYSIPPKGSARDGSRSETT